MAKKGKQTKIPGTERADICEDIEKAAAAYVEVRDARMELTKKEVDAQAKLLVAMKANRLSRYRCEREDLEVEIVPENEKAKVRKVAPPEADDDAGDAAA